MKTSALGALGAASVTSGDLVAFVDTSAGSRVKVTAQDLIDAGARASQAATSGIIRYDGTTILITGTTISIAGTATVTSASANALVVGRQGATSPGLQVDASVATCVTGVKITPRASGAGASVAVVGGATDEKLTIDGKGAGLIQLNKTGTGNVEVGTNLQMNSAKSIVDTNGNELIDFPATVASAVTEIVVSNAATGAGPSISTAGGDTNINLSIVPKGTGVVSVNGGIVSIDPTDGVGYATGAGGAVTQLTSRTTGVTLNKVAGAITLFSAAGSASFQSFTVTNSAVGANDTIDIVQKSGTDLYQIFITAVAAGSFRVTFATTGGTTTEAPVFNFTVNKGAAS